MREARIEDGTIRLTVTDATGAGTSAEALSPALPVLHALLFFRRKLLESLRQPVWIITGLSAPLLARRRRPRLASP